MPPCVGDLLLAVAGGIDALCPSSEFELGRIVWWLAWFWSCRGEGLFLLLSLAADDVRGDTRPC
jgi:hypothetical protein